MAARIGDSDFALLLPVLVNAREVAGKLLALFRDMTAALTTDTAAASIGMWKMTRGQDLPSLMAQTFSALMTSHAQGAEGVGQVSQDAEAVDTQAMAPLIKLALEKNRARLLSLPVTDFKANCCIAVHDGIDAGQCHRLGARQASHTGRRGQSVDALDGPANNQIGAGKAGERTPSARLVHQPFSTLNQR